MGMGEVFESRRYNENMGKAARSLGEAMNQAKNTIDTEGAKTFKPILKLVRLFTKNGMLGPKCDFE